MQKKPPIQASDRILEYIRTLPDARIIENFWVSYTDAIYYIIHRGLRHDYQRWAEDRAAYLETDRRTRPEISKPQKKYEN